VPARFHETFDACYQALCERGYTLFTLEPECGDALSDVALPTKSAFILGHEEVGISFDRNDYPAVRCMHIPQFGRMESLNVSVAASIVMYEYVRRLPPQEG
jgi:tRNA G18 (ribose-2'-O)-methylase SpoU